MAEHFPSPENAQEATITEQMDMSNELENQAAAEAAVAAAVVAAEADANAHSESSHNLDHANRQDMHLPQPGQGPPPPPAYQRQLRVKTLGSSASAAPFAFSAPHRQAPDSPLTNAQQLVVLREFYSRNPNPGKKDLEMLAARTGRPWNKIREYFRQRRNKLRGLEDLEAMNEPGRASGWLQVTYRPSPLGSSVSQLSLYNAYKQRFDPYSASSPLLGGQELIQLACATFPGCEMARDEGDYVLRGLKDKDSISAEDEWNRNVDTLVEPLRGATWLLSNFQHPSDLSSPSTLAQTDLYSAYATRFSSVIPDGESSLRPSDAHAVPNEAELKEFEANMATSDLENEMDDINSYLPQATPMAHEDVGGKTSAQSDNSEEIEMAADRNYEISEDRLLNPVELIALTRMTFPKCEPIVDSEGRFVICGLERRDAVEKSRNLSDVRPSDMFPFAMTMLPNPSDASHPFTSLLKRKLTLLTSESDSSDKRSRSNVLSGGIGVNIGVPVAVPATALEPELAEEDRELLEGLRRFRGSKLGREVRDTCVNQ